MAEKSVPFSEFERRSTSMKRIYVERMPTLKKRFFLSEIDK